ncbi:MAG: response regulator containing a CheY-like receiver domain and an DNA-binding domain [Blastococcus sp.]|nr:response regulator containing a CheY-like receiver domain and an DNA-binding domain [Blastococcus sp.]
MTVAVRCLIVDDNRGFLHAARELLEQEGMVVVGVAATTAEALRGVADLRPDVTLVDVDLGDESGFELARRLADDPGVDPGSLVMVSAHVEEDVAELMETSPAIGFLYKPTLSAEAIDRLLREAGRRRNL